MGESEEQMATEASVTIPVHRPRLKEKLFFMLSGAIVSVPLTLFISQLSDSIFSPMPAIYADILSVAVLAPLIEEFSKAYPLFYRHGETERSIFVLGFLVGIGFGIIEFIEYVVFFNAPFFVRLPGIFFHASTTSIVAFGIGRKRPIVFYFVAVSLHFMNNLLVVLGPVWYVGGPVVIGLAYFLSWYLYNRTVERMIPF
jgi:RsiW-degrading membrane proteinase PrsW (M82 family)